MKFQSSALAIAAALFVGIAASSAVHGQTEPEFEIPAGARIVKTYRPEEIRFLPSAEYRGNGFRPMFDPRYFPALEPLTTTIDAGLAGFHAPEVAVYPAGGADAGTLAKVARQSRVLVAIDTNPAVYPSRANRATLEYTHASGSPWRVYTLEKEDELRLEQAIGSLHEAVPGFRPLQVTVFETQEMGAAKIHLLIKFDSGAGTPTREYVRIQGDVKDSALGAKGREPAWWLSELDRLKPGLVMLKGGMQTLREQPGSSGIRSHFLKWVRDRNGLLIEDYSVENDGLMAVSQGHPLDGAHSADVEDIPYGYEPHDLVTGKQKAPRMARVHFFGPAHAALTGVCPGAYCDCVSAQVRAAAHME